MSAIDWQSRWVAGQGAVIMVTQRGDTFTLDSLVGSTRFKIHQAGEVVEHLRRAADSVEATVLDAVERAVAVGATPADSEEQT